MITLIRDTWISYEYSKLVYLISTTENFKRYPPYNGTRSFLLDIGELRNTKTQVLDRESENYKKLLKKGVVLEDDFRNLCKKHKIKFSIVEESGYI